MIRKRWQSPIKEDDQEEVPITNIRRWSKGGGDQEEVPITNKKGWLKGGND
jgi:hypothetical protein